MRFKPSFSGGVGYIDVHCSTVKGDPAALTRSTAASISFNELIPVERKIGKPDAAIALNMSSLLTSPDATFHAATPTRVRSSTASTEKGELRNLSPFSRACFLSPHHCSSVNSIRFQYSYRVASCMLNFTRHGSPGVDSADAICV